MRAHVPFASLFNYAGIVDCLSEKATDYFTPAAFSVSPLKCKCVYDGAARVSHTERNDATPLLGRPLLFSFS
jgi:hypothetical protein